MSICMVDWATTAMHTRVLEYAAVIKSGHNERCCARREDAVHSRCSAACMHAHCTGRRRGVQYVCMLTYATDECVVAASA